MSRRMYAIRQFIAVGFALLAFLACVAKCTACTPPVTPDELDDLNKDLAECRAEARKARDAGATSSTAYMRYEDCKRLKGVQQ